MKTRRARAAIHVRDDVLRTVPIDGPYMQTQAGPGARRLDAREAAAALEVDVDQELEDRIVHRVTATVEELAELEELARDEDLEH